MKYSLGIEQKNKKYLQECSEIHMTYDKNIDVIKLIETYPDKDFLVEIPYFKEDIDWRWLSDFNKMSQGRLIVALSDMEDVSLCNQFGIKFFYGFPSSTFEELQALKDLGVCYFKLAAPLFFQLPDVKNLGVPIRTTANKSRWNDLVLTGIFGTWIRPEDVEYYEEYIDIIDFFYSTSEQESVLYEVYKSGLWNGRLNEIVFDLNYPKVSNGLLHSDFTKQRISCGQSCQKNGKCNICLKSFLLADAAKIKEYANSKN